MFEDYHIKYPAVMVVSGTNRLDKVQVVKLEDGLNLTASMILAEVPPGPFRIRRGFGGLVKYPGNDI